MDPTQYQSPVAWTPSVQQPPQLLPTWLHLLLHIIQYFSLLPQLQRQRPQLLLIICHQRQWRHTMLLQWRDMFEIHSILLHEIKPFEKNHP